MTERDLPTLSKDDLNTSASEVAEAQKQELGKWTKGSFFIFPEAEGRNKESHLFSLGVEVQNRRRPQGGKRQALRERLKDADADSLATLAGTATRWGQRRVCATAAQPR